MIIENSIGNFPKVREIWFNRLIRVSGGALILGGAGYLFGLRHFNFLLFFACILDLNSDSLMGLRQIIFKQRSAFIFQTGKKLIQLFGLTLIYLTKVNLSSQLVSIIIGLPAVVAIFLDFTVIGKPSSKPSFKVSVDSIKIWGQSGGTLLAGLDLWIIGSFKEFGWVLYLTFARRISNSLGIFGATISVETLNDVGENGLSSKTIRPRIFNGFFLTLFISVFLSLVMTFVLAPLTGRPSSVAAILVVSSILCSIPLGILTASINSIFIGMKFYKYVSMSTYLSTFVYLFWLSIMPHVIGIAWTIGLGSAINLGLELLLQVIFFQRIRVNGAKS